MSDTLPLYLEIKKLHEELKAIWTTLSDATAHLITKFESANVNLTKKLNQIEGRLVIIERKEDNIMTQVAQDFESLRTAIDSATNAVAQRIANLSNKITNSMTDQEVASLKAEFQQAADRLNVLAADPDDPVPDGGNNPPVV